MKRFVMSIVVFLVLCVYSYAEIHAAGVPQLINYQGYLTDKDGNPLPTAEYKLSFSIFNESTGGTKMWGPQTFKNVPVVKGYFNVILGPNDSNTPPLPIASAFTSEKAYLSIAINNALPITPRQQILSAPYAFEAVNAIHGVPVGTIVAYYGNNDPEGWLSCNGQGIPNEDKYKKLKELIGNNTPDLRGRTIVGAGQGDSLTMRYLGGKDGEENHKLLPEEMPTHGHGVYSGSTGSAQDAVGLGHSNSAGIGSPANRGGIGGLGYYYNSFDSPTLIKESGSSTAHNNMQPFYVLNFIIKY